MEIIQNTLSVAWHLRWVIVAIAFAVLGAAYADSVLDRRRLRRRVAELEDGHRRLVTRLNERRAQRRRQPIIRWPGGLVTTEQKPEQNVLDDEEFCPVCTVGMTSANHDQWQRPAEIGLLAACALPACSAPVPQSGDVCDGCRRAFGPMLVESSAPARPVAEVAASLAQRDQDVLAAQREQLRIELAARQAAGEPVVKAGQVCWLCTERRKCTQVDGRWECPDCIEAPQNPSPAGSPAPTMDPSERANGGHPVACRTGTGPAGEAEQVIPSATQCGES